MREIGFGQAERRWLLLRSFYSSWRRFQGLFAEYERRVNVFSERFKTDRRTLKLVPEDLASLIDFKALEDLRDRDLSLLREVSHELFRLPDRTDRFDHSISIIYHELSALKEEHYTLREEFVHEESIEYDRFYREVNQYYPKRLRHIRNLYKKADRRLRELLHGASDDRVVQRSLFLYGEDLVEGLYEGGVLELYAHLCPTGGAAEAYAIVGDSFRESGFLVEAEDAYERSLSCAARPELTPRRRGAKRLVATLRERVSADLEALRADPEFANGTEA